MCVTTATMARSRSPTTAVQLFAQINNLLNHRCYTASQLALTGLTAQGTVQTSPLSGVDGNYPLIYSQFDAPGAPIGICGGMRVNF